MARPRRGFGAQAEHREKRRYERRPSDTVGPPETGTRAARHGAVFRELQVDQRTGVAAKRVSTDDPNQVNREGYAADERIDDRYGSQPQRGACHDMCTGKHCGQEARRPETQGQSFDHFCRAIDNAGAGRSDL